MKITENTFVSLSVVAAAAGAIAWLTHIAWVSESNAEMLRIVSERQDDYTNKISEIKKDIAVIKTILKDEQEGN